MKNMKTSIQRRHSNSNQPSLIHNCSNNITIDTNFFSAIASESPVNKQVITLKKLLESPECFVKTLLHKDQYEREIKPLMRTSSSPRSIAISTFLTSLKSRDRLEKTGAIKNHLISSFLQSEEDPSTKVEVEKDRFLFDLALERDCVIVTRELNTFQKFHSSRNYPSKDKRVSQIKILPVDRISDSANSSTHEKIQALCKQLRSIPKLCE